LEKDVTSDPGNATLFGAKRVVLAFYGLTNPIEKFLGALCHNFLVDIDLKRHAYVYSQTKEREIRFFVYHPE